MQIDYIKLIVSIVICLLIGFIAGISTSKSIDSWYSKIKKPTFNPPSWIFGPVWTILYVLMGVSLYLLWTSKIDNRLAIMFFVIQLVLNFLWSYLFFGLQNPLIAFIEIVILWIMIILTMIYAYPVSQTASLLMIPYILWVTFASILNLSIYLLNH